MPFTIERFVDEFESSNAAIWPAPIAACNLPLAAANYLKIVANLVQGVVLASEALRVRPRHGAAAV